VEAFLDRRIDFFFGKAAHFVRSAIQEGFQVLRQCRPVF
jgi:hypothetical protein